MQEPEPKRLRWTGGAIALVVIGLVILIPSGLCTASIGIPLLISMPFTPFDNWGAAASYLVLILVIGGPLILLGAFLVRTGLRARREE